MKSARLDGIELRDGVDRAVDRTWKRIGKPGTVWTGPQRVTIAREFRRAHACHLCAERKRALSPSAVDGTHATVGDLPAAAVDAAHRIATDSGRLSSRWYDEFLDAGLGPQHLVELTGVAATVAAVDTFHRAVGQDPPRLPAARRGKPSDDLADVAIIHSARVPTVALEDAVDPLAGFYAAQQMVPNIMKALTLCPDETIAFYGLAHHLYSLGPGAPPDDWTLSRPQIELVAATVSNHNDCFY